jgi:hypothetical protein
MTPQEPQNLLEASRASRRRSWENLQEIRWVVKDTVGVEYYHIQVGALETQEFRTSPVPFWLICFSDTVKGPLRQMYFVVLLPDGTVVEPRVARRM